MAEKCMPMKKTQFFKVRSLPKVLEKDSFYIVGDASSSTVDLYITDKWGKAKLISESGGGGEDLILYRTDINPNDGYYYYGYQYQSYWIIVRVEEGNVTNRAAAVNTAAYTFLTNWDLRETLTYK